MHKLLRAAIGSIAFSLFASSLFAQQMTIDPSGYLPAGGMATVDYSNPSLAGQEVVIVVTGDDNTTVQITIQLDAQGNGKGTVNVSSTWRSAEFQAPSVANQTLPVW
ncbi:MAG: hypothetical protein R3F29_02765 [Planctomycetota bacterium]